MELTHALARHAGAVAFRFGDGPALNAEVLSLVIEGRKTVTCDAVAGFEARGEPLPEVGRVDIACDWSWRPVCAIRTVAVSIMAFDEMTDELVADQGEFADLDDWRQGYRAFLQRTVGFAPGIMMLVERFCVVEAFAWPVA